MAAEVDTRPQYGHHDSRNGLGYGVLKPSGRDAPRSAQSVYPYHKDIDTGEDIEDEFDSELIDQISSKVLSNIQTTDFMASYGTDPFYFAAGNTKLSESPNAMGTSMVPFPKMYSKAVHTGSPSPLRYYGPTSGFGSTAQPTGTKKGYSKAPISLAQAMYADEDEIEDFVDVLCKNDEDIHGQDHVDRYEKLTKSITDDNSLY